MLVVENGTSMYFEKLDASQVTVNDRQTSPGDSSILKFKQMKTKKAGVNIRVEPDKKSELVVSLKKKGEEVLVLTQKKNKSGETWYLVMCDEGIGYLRNDMVK
jgi:SH3-like domain-containing protein